MQILAILKILVFCLLLIAFKAEAQINMFVGYDDFCGLPVHVGETSQDAVATNDKNGNPIIFLDSKTLANWSWSRIFALAHECGHHKLGHLSSQERFSRQHMNATRRQELAADCWAAKALAKGRYFADLERTIAQNIAAGALSVGPYPTGYERASRIATCIDVKLPRNIQALGDKPEKSNTKRKILRPTSELSKSLKFRIRKFLTDTISVASSYSSDRIVVSADQDACTLSFHNLEYPDSTTDFDMKDVVYIGYGAGKYDPPLNLGFKQFEKTYLRLNPLGSKYHYLNPKDDTFLPYYEHLHVPEVLLSIHEIYYLDSHPKLDAENRQPRSGENYATSQTLQFSTAIERDGFFELLSELKASCQQ